MDGPAAGHKRHFWSPGGLIFSCIAIVVGAGAGLGAVFFRTLIAVIHNVLFGGHFSFAYDANRHTPPAPWGAFVIGVPVLGAFVVTFLVTRFAPEAKGHGVPEVVDAIYFGKGVIRPVVAVVKSLASAVSIGSGGSVGREGPIVQIGASLGSTLGQLLYLPANQIDILIAAGGGAGIAATFNTPVGGVLFALEIMMTEISDRTLVPTVLATVTATTVSWFFFGDRPSFAISPPPEGFMRCDPLAAALAYVLLGVITGLVSWLFIRSLYTFEDLFNKYIPRHPFLRHGLGMLLVGLLIYACLRFFGHYYVQGVGYATIQDIMSGVGPGAWLLVLLCFLRLLATVLTLGSGASGGVFSPALFMGATAGAAFGSIVHWLLPGARASPVAFAIGGMAGVVGGSTGAALTAIVMIFEMTRDYAVIVPITITVAVAYGVRRSIGKESIYTMKLARRGRVIPDQFRRQ